MDNPIRLAQYEQQRQFETELISASVQGAVKILAQGAQRALRWMEKRAVTEYIWKQCAMYAEQLTEGHPEKDDYRMLRRHLEMISGQLFNKQRDIKPEDIASARDIKTQAVTLDAAQAAQLGVVLYQLYSAKHLWKKYSKERCEMDEYDLFLMWAQLGINPSECQALLVKCKDYERTGSFPYAGVNYFMRCVFSNLSISMPNINHGVAEQINDQFLYYVPNGHTQQMAQRATKFIGKAAIGTGVAAFGIVTENPALIASGVGEVLSLISVNSSDRAIAAEKCLLESGIPQRQAEQLVHDSMKGSLKRKQILLE